MKKNSSALLTAALLALAAKIFLSDDDSHSGSNVTVQHTSPPIPPGAASKYIDTYKLMAKTTQDFYRIPKAVTLAQGGLESAWGTSNLATKANNHFGIKADASWHGQVYTTADGLKYRKYNTAGESFTDHAKFLTTNPRYSNAFNTTDPILFAQAVAAAGYAEDPQYFQKVSSVIRMIA